MGNLSGKKVLVTGACGTIGRELVRQLVQDMDVGELVAIDNNESDLFFLEQRLSDRRATFFLRDVRERNEIDKLCSGIDVIFHTAALKHVVLCERSPYEAVQTNIQGVRNIIDAASSNGVSRVIFTSSDKAVNPTSVMGTSKLMGERLITAANSGGRQSGTIFASTRFGNVLGSRGSVIPIFREQIRKGGPVTLTDQQMTRFIMSIAEAVELVIRSAEMARGGEVFVTKMPVIRVEDLAQAMIDELADSFGQSADKISIETIGTKPGEKLYEELISEEETRRALELQDYFVVLPAFKALYRQIEYRYPNLVSSEISRAYRSDTEAALSRDQLVSFLRLNELLFEDEQDYLHPAARYWPDREDV